MSTVTFYIPEEVYEKMKQHKEIKWSYVVREAILRKIKLLEEAKFREYGLKRMLEEGEDAEELFVI